MPCNSPFKNASAHMGGGGGWYIFIMTTSWKATLPDPSRQSRVGKQRTHTRFTPNSKTQKYNSEVRRLEMFLVNRVDTPQYTWVVLTFWNNASLHGMANISFSYILSCTSFQQSQHDHLHNVLLLMITRHYLGNKCKKD